MTPEERKAVARKGAYDLMNIIVETTKEAQQTSIGGIPNGHLWVAISSRINISFDTYMTMLMVLKDRKCIRESNNVLIFLKDMPPFNPDPATPIVPLNE